MASLNHVHTYIRMKKPPTGKKGKKGDYYKCKDPHCTHFIDRHLLRGKASLCNSCGAEIIIGNEELKRAEPKCINCMNTRKALEFKEKLVKVQEILQEIKPELVENDELPLLEVTPTAPIIEPKTYAEQIEDEFDIFFEHKENK